MFDYKLLAALAAVVEQAGFERAAQVLGLSQSAVSQRIKLLEARSVSRCCCARCRPGRPSWASACSITCSRCDCSSGTCRARSRALDDGDLPERLRIALNADSLATWWAAAVAPFCAGHRVLLDHVVEDQAVGLKRMRAGEVAACVCAAERPLAGARSQYLGRCVTAHWPARRSSNGTWQDGPRPKPWPRRRPSSSGRMIACSTATSRRWGLGRLYPPSLPVVGGLCPHAAERAGLGLVPELQVRGEL